MRLYPIPARFALLLFLGACSGEDGGPTGPATEPGLPAAPGQLVVAFTDSTTASLTWSDNSTNEDGFRLQARASSSQTYFTFGQVRPDTNSVTLAGLIPTADYILRVAAFNSVGQAASPPLAFTVPLPARIISTSLPGAFIGVSYDATLILGPRRVGDVVTWSLAEGALPPGLTLSSSGVISGTPTTQGSFTFIVRLQVGDVAAPAEREFTIDAQPVG